MNKIQLRMRLAKENENYPDELSYGLKDHVALITGASSGIGKAIALKLGMAGAKVVINFHNEEKEADEVEREIIKNGSDAKKIRADVSVESEVVEMFRSAIHEFGTIDILINNSGIQADSPFHEMSLEKWQRVIDVNLTGYFLCAREAAKEFLKRGVVAGRSTAAGKMIFISSVHDHIPWAGHVNYAASKGGIMLLLKSIAQELAPKRIRVNGIAPGAIKTPINTAAWATPEARKKLLELIPYKRIGEPEDIANVAAWLASDESDYITGAIINTDGGMSLYPSFMHGG